MRKLILATSILAFIGLNSGAIAQSGHSNVHKSYTGFTSDEASVPGLNGYSNKSTMDNKSHDLNADSNEESSKTMDDSAADEDPEENQQPDEDSDYKEPMNDDASH